jgi:hypothetical protein
MNATLAPLLLAGLAWGAAPAGNPAPPAREARAAPAAPAAVVQHEEPAAERGSVRLETAEDLARLCGALEPAERVRLAGDAVERGEAAARQVGARGAALKERYAARVPAAKLAFAPYDAPERRLALQEPVQLPVADGTARLWPTEHRGLAVEADAAAARRVLEAQRRGALALELAFELPEDATCGTGARGKSFTVPVDPVAWRWLDGETVLAHGGAAAERPLLTAAQGARPVVEVGDPISGPLDASKLVLARAGELEGCYREALKRNPAADGVLVADIGGARTAISADSVGDEAFAACVQRALGPLAPGVRAAVPIRFELAPPGR